MSDSTERMTQVEKLLALFKPERYSYLVICFVSCITLISLAVFLIVNGTEIHYVLGMFGSSGVIAVSMGRMLKMWNDVIKVMFNTKTDTDD